MVDLLIGKLAVPKNYNMRNLIKLTKPIAVVFRKISKKSKTKHELNIVVLNKTKKDRNSSSPFQKTYEKLQQHNTNNNITQ